MHGIKYKSKIVTFISSASLLLLTAFVAPAIVSAGGAPIPAGCPGSTLSLVGNKEEVAKKREVCKTIPLGCPGSTAPGVTDVTPTNCPYAAPAGNGHICGGGSNASTLSIDIGCKGKGNAITDAAFAIIRFLTNGVGLIVIGSIIVGGIQYSAARNDPQATAQAIHRIQSTLIALVIYIFGYAILNYILPQGFFLK